MALTVIAKGGLSATIDSKGAQLTSLALDGAEYLWQQDPKWWPRSAPVLFPIVGSLRGNEAESAAGPCTMGRHGIARGYEHKVVDVADDGSSVTFELRDTLSSRSSYPYQFKLNMTYAITGPATLTQTFTVTNTGGVNLPFSVGGHPAFNVPAPGGAEAGEAFEDYELVFAEPWTAVVPKLVDGGLFDDGDCSIAVDNSDVMPITHRTFDVDTLMFSRVPGNTVSLRGRKSGHGVRIDFPGFDFLGVWSAAGDAPFVALEPWTGHSTLLSEDNVFEHKENITILKPGAVFERAFDITVF